MFTKSCTRILYHHIATWPSSYTYNCGQEEAMIEAKAAAPASCNVVAVAGSPGRGRG